MNKKFVLTGVVLILIALSGCVEPTETDSFLDDSQKLSGMDFSNQNRLSAVLVYDYNASIEINGETISSSNGTVNRTSGEITINDDSKILFDGENYTVQKDNDTVELDESRVWSPQLPTEFNISSYSNGSVSREQREDGIFVVARLHDKKEIERDVARIVTLESSHLDSQEEYQLSNTTTVYELPSEGLGVTEFRVNGTIKQDNESVDFEYSITYKYKENKV